jgi:flagellar basal body-associated protein FliL
MMGYVASLAGLAIGFLAEKGYNLLKGKQGKGKLWILIVAILFGILLGTLGGYTVMLMKELDFQISVGESFTAIVQAISQDADARTEFLSNMGMGILFAALGVYGILRNTRKAVADTKVTVLE